MATALSPDEKERAPLREGEDSSAKRHDKMGQPEDAIAMLKADHQTWKKKRARCSRSLRTNWLMQ